MKVAYVTMTFPVPSEAFAGTDVRTLLDAGVDVSVYTIRAPRRNATELLEQRRLATLRLSQGTLAADVRGLLSCLRRPVLALRLLIWLLRVSWKRPIQFILSVVAAPRAMGILDELERHRPDVVHLFWGHYPCIVGFLVRSKLRHTVLSLFLGAYDLTRKFGGTRWVVRRADLVLTHAACNLATIEMLGVNREQIHLVYRGIDLSIFAGEPQKVPRRIVTAGRLEKGKGVDHVLRVFREIHSRWPDATLRVLGQGRQRAGLERLGRALGIDRAVTFLGHLAQHELAEQLRAAEVFLLMSDGVSERLPNVVKEAMASHCVCVVTDTEGMSELVESGRHGFVVGKGNVGEAVTWVDAIFRRRVDISAILTAASERVTRHFDASESMRLYREHWGRALQTQRNRTGRGVTDTSSALARSNYPA